MDIKYISHELHTERGGDTIDSFIAIAAYKGIVATVIKESKYRLASAILDEFMDIVEPALIGAMRRLVAHSEFIGLVPIPLHPARHRARGFNQSELIARRISKVTGIPVERCIRRVVHNAPQAHMPHDLSRAENVKGIFQIIPGVSLKGRDFIVIDDVVTTGSTVTEAAGVLKAAGARRILVLSLAKG